MKADEYDGMEIWYRGHEVGFEEGRNMALRQQGAIPVFVRRDNSYIWITGAPREYLKIRGMLEDEETKEFWLLERDGGMEP